MRYPSDLKEKEWDLIKDYFAQDRMFGRPLKYERKEIVNAIIYVTKTGCQWRQLPKDFPPFPVVYYYFKRWSMKGIWEKVLDQLNKKFRLSRGKKEHPSYGIVDSQSGKTQYGSEDRGIDGGKKIKGHKRHIGVDTLGCLHAVNVHAANEHDTKSGRRIFDRLVDKFPNIKGFSADAGYRGTAVEFVTKALGLTLDISTRIKDEWAILPKRWVVERTLSWINNFRRMAKDFEILTANAENFIRIAMIKIMLAKCI